MAADSSNEPHSHLFDADGTLDAGRFDASAIEVLEAALDWLGEVDRAVLLPIDLIVVLCRRDHPLLTRAIASAARGTSDTGNLLAELEALGRRVDRPSPSSPALHVEQFSLGLVGILEDALAWERESGRQQIREETLARVVRWRAELQDSASVRWAIRQLAQPGANRLFDVEGLLRRDVFTTEMWAALRRGVQMSALAGMPFLGTPHLVAALCLQAESVMVRAAQRAAVDPRMIHDELLRIIGTRSPVQSRFVLSRRTLTPRLVRMLSSAVEHGEDGEPVAEGELLRSFVVDGGSSWDLVASLGVGRALKEELDEYTPPEIHLAPARERHGGIEFGEHARAKGPPVIDELGRDLTAEVRAGKVPTVVGRDEELQRIINVLMRKEQRNPLLTGEAGVGKTALAIGLAIRIEEGTVPERLREVRVVEINGASLVGGTSYRGELEARIQALLEEARDGTILFMDEAHAIFAPHSAGGKPAEVPNHFKAALASGDIAVVAATTDAEYRRWIEEDPALQRRFERIHIPEMTTDLTAQILRGLAPEYEREYGVTVTPEAVEASIELSRRFIPEQSLPDKAKKALMDATIGVAAEVASSGGARIEAGSSAGTPSKRVVSRQDVARQISQKTGVPLDRILRGSSIQWWKRLQQRLEAAFPDRPTAVSNLVRALVRARLRGGSDEEVRAACAIALLGPQMSERTRVAEVLANELYGSPRALLHLELSDYQEAHSMSRLFGAAPGYVGYQDEDALVTPLRRSPACVVLLSSFELAHPRVQDRLLRLIREGEITDTRGLRADARHAIFVLDIEASEKAQAIGFGATADTGLHVDLLGETLANRLFRAQVSPVDFRPTGCDLALLMRLFDERLADFSRTLRAEYDVELRLATSYLDELRAELRDEKSLSAMEELFQRRVVQPVTDKLLIEESPGPILRVGRPEDTLA